MAKEPTRAQWDELRIELFKLYHKEHRTAQWITSELRRRNYKVTYAYSMSPLPFVRKLINEQQENAILSLLRMEFPTKI